MKPKGLLAAASMTAPADTPSRSQIAANSEAKAMLTRRNVFSRIFDASAISSDATRWVTTPRAAYRPAALSRESDRDRTRNDDDLVRTYRTEHLRKLIERLDRGLVLERCRGQAEHEHITGPQGPDISRKSRRRRRIVTRLPLRRSEARRADVVPDHIETTGPPESEPLSTPPAQPDDPYGRPTP